MSASRLELRRFGLKASLVQSQGYWFEDKRERRRKRRTEKWRRQRGAREQQRAHRSLSERK